eukprot:CAMPEP_0195126124 /NCGR_PEP_ID=MMETSP0448-20130528/134317_1 /TAXON_ID=66468 /ORGANISM="Heterocapsa triquestra, Strain CCMP 448" /LENGTH=139 /DNA_ID=CAMNT_0040163801 /DNA_START=117 /DNA_END=535 /DNA_ORIENTATION=+
MTSKGPQKAKHPVHVETHSFFMVEMVSWKVCFCIMPTENRTLGRRGTAGGRRRPGSPLTCPSAIAGERKSWQDFVIGSVDVLAGDPVVQRAKGRQRTQALIVCLRTAFEDSLAEDVASEAQCAGSGEVADNGPPHQELV